MRLGFAGEGNDTLGYDFRDVDVEGALTGRPVTLCFIEVKANGGELASRFAMTRHGWEVAENAHERGEVYVIARVSDVSTEAPRLARLLVDPPGMEAEGRLSLQAQSWWIEQPS